MTIVPIDLLRNLALAGILHGRFDRVGETLQFLLRHRTLAAGDLEAAHQLPAVVGLAPLVALDHLKRHLLDLLVTREAALALACTRGGGG